MKKLKLIFAVLVLVSVSNLFAVDHYIGSIRSNQSGSVYIQLVDANGVEIAKTYCDNRDAESLKRMVAVALTAKAQHSKVKLYWVSGHGWSDIEVLGD